MKIIILSLCGLFFSVSTYASSTSGYWIGVFPTYKFGDKHKISLQAETRRQGDSSFELYRPGYHFKVKNWLNFGVGLDLFTVESREVRHWLEVNLKTPQRFFGQRLHLRWRHEFRDLEGVDPSGARSRVMAVSQFDLIKKMRLEAILFNEVFYSQRSFSGEKNFFDRNWLGLRLRQHYKNNFLDLGGFWEKVFSSEDTEGFVFVLSLGRRF